MKFLADIEVEQGSDATFVDNAKAFFGTGNDLQIYHDGSNSYIDQTGTGKIILNTSSTGINVQSGTGETRFTKSGTDSEIKIDDTNQVNKVVLKSDGDSLFLGGDLGVGTTTTDSIFHIKDTGKLTQLTIESDTGQAGQISFISPSVFDGSISMESDGDFRISNSANTQFLFTGDTSNARLGLGVNNTSPTQQLHLTDNIRVEGAYYDSTGASGSPGSNGQVLSSTVTGTAWVAAGGGGGGTIGGTIALTELAVGDANDSIDGSSKLTFAFVSGGAGYDKLKIGDGSTGSNQVLMDLNTLGTGSSRGRFTLSDAGVLRGYLGITGGDEEVTLLSNANLVLESGSTDDIIMASQSGSKVGIGNTSPSEKLEVTGRIKASAGVQVGTELDNVAASGTVGTFRYRLVNGAATAGTNYSYVDMVMQTGITGGISSYEWVNIVTNRW